MEDDQDTNNEGDKISKYFRQITPNVELENSGPPQSIKDLEFSSCDKLVTVQGVVVKLSTVRPRCTSMCFECGLCQTKFTVEFPDGNYVPPRRCTDTECRSKMFRPLRTNVNTETIDWQKIRLQDLACNQSIEDGGLPKTIDCELTGDLVDSCIPGSIVTVTGVLKVSSTSEIKRRGQVSYTMYIAANSVTNAQQVGGLVNNLDHSSTDGDLLLFRQINESRNRFQLLTDSLCPHIYGHRYVKSGLLLSLFGGSKSDSTRNSIHVLIVGDPGLGKTHLLQACSNVAPRGIYVSGNTTTVAGLTVALNRDSTSGNDFAIEAGALVIADDGCCCIDEFDKMTSQHHNALLEVMEQQQVSVFKSGVHSQFPARASVLAAANPYGGHYDESKSIAQNLHTNPALLSRFDLIFVLRDTPDKERDSFITKHVMRARSLDNSSASSSNTSNRFRGSSSSSSLLDETEEVFVPVADLKNYIFYARNHVNPKLSLEAGRELKSFFEHLQQSTSRIDCLPIGVRHFESLIRLTQARARCDLCEVADEQHAREVIEVVRESMNEHVDQNRSLNNNSSISVKKSKKVSQKDQLHLFLRRLEKIRQTKGDSMFSLQELKDVYNEMNLNWLRGFEDFVTSLNLGGYLICKAGRMYQLMNYE